MTLSSPCPPCLRGESFLQWKSPHCHRPDGDLFCKRLLSISMANLFEPPRYIAIEGPIRVGKTTLCKVIAETLHAQRISEPENNAFLNGFYKGERGAAFQT